MPPAVVMPVAWIASMTSMVSLAKACVHPPWPDCGIGQPQQNLPENTGVPEGAVEGPWAPQTDDHLRRPVKGECPN